jgi:uncharacterized protein (TIGR03437 family)
VAAGTYRAALQLSFSEGSSRRVEVLLVVAAGGGRTAYQRGARAAADCTATKLLPVFTRLGENFRVNAGWPTPIEVKVVDDCGRAMLRDAVTTTFSNGDAPLALASLRDGRWSGTWPARRQDISEVAVKATAVTLNPKLEGAIEIRGGLGTEQQAPTLSAGGVLNAASFQPDAPLAPGTLVSIFGEGLAADTAAAQGSRLPTELAQTAVAVGGRPLPLMYVSAGQINAVLPFDVPLNSRQQIVVRSGASYSVPDQVSIAEAAPGIFTRDQTGKGQAIVVHPDGKLVEAGNPTCAGQTVVIYAVGLGPVQPTVDAADMAPSDPLARAAATVSVRVGKQAAAIDYAGLTPGFAGLYQVNARIPEGVASGDAVEVVVTGGQMESQAETTIAVSACR